MVSRSIGILVAPCFALFSLMVPLGPVYSTNAIVGGIAATILAALAVLDQRAALGVALLGLLTAFTPLVFRSTLVELTASVCWGVTMVVAFVGPFSHAPLVSGDQTAGTSEALRKTAPAGAFGQARPIGASTMRFT